MASRPGGPYQQRESDRPTKSQLFPFLGKGKEVVSKAHLIPYAVLFLLGLTLANPFLWFLALGLAIGTYYLVYRQCGKVKPMWLPLVPAGMTALIIYFGLDFFNQVFSIPMTVPNATFDPQTWSQYSYPTLLYNIFVQVGLKEELMKAIPVLLCAFFAPKITSAFARPLEVNEPLDGILLATGSALGFTMFETMLQYVPQAMHQGGLTEGLNLLLVRVGGDLSGHIAYSGYWGYFIGLAMMKPKGRWQTIAIGWGFAGILHALWDSLDSPLPMLAVGIISYALLGAAILKARQISPTRGSNFATQLYHGAQAPPQQPQFTGMPAPLPSQYGTPSQPQQPFNPGFPPAPPFPPPPGAPAWTPPQTVGPPPPARPMTVIPANAPSVPPGAPVIPQQTAPPQQSSGLTFFVAGQRNSLIPGRRFAEADLPGLRAAAGDGIVAEVTRHPADPTILGLKNLSTAAWMAWTPKGESREIPSGKTIRLSPGTSVQFGNIRGEIL